MRSYYNEFDPKAAAWLRELIRRGLIADGVVDERSILDVRPEDLIGFTQCHFFAGIGGWSYALRLAGWPDERPVWTGSPPCQPFSIAGAQKGREDDRHLAPHFINLVSARRPQVLFGEQVASAAVFGKASSRARVSVDTGAADGSWAWLDDLFDRLEAARYACGASDIPAASVGAPHIRQRTFFGAVALEGLDNAASARHEPARIWAEVEAWNEARLRGPECRCATGGLADADDAGSQGRGIGGNRADQRVTGASSVASAAHAPDSPWGTADWLYSRDGKWRPVEPGTFPLAHGVPARVGRLRGYGNAIVPQAAAEFIRAFDAASGDY